MPEGEATVANPVLHDDEADQLIEMAHQVDASKDGEIQIPEEPGQETPPQKAEPEKVEPTKPEATPTDRQRDEHGRFVQKQEGEQPAEGEPETAYTKAQKEQIRKERTWQQIEAEKQAVRQEYAAVQQRAQQMEAERAQMYQQNLPRAVKNKFNAVQYQEFADESAKNGDWENAFKAQKTVEELLAYEHNYYAQAAEQHQQAILDQAFQHDLQQAIQEDPEAAPDSGSPLSKEIDTLLREHPYIYFLPQGAIRAVEIAKLRMAASRLAEVEEKLAKYEAAEQGRQKSSRPIRPGSTVPGKQRSFDDMDVSEMEEHLQALSSDADEMYGR